MGLELKNHTSEKSDASALRLYDVTKIFSADNPGGWESSTTAYITDVVAATMTVYLTNPETLQVNVDNFVVIDVYPTLPNFINDPYEVLATALGYADGVIPDGLITVEYNVDVVTGGSSRASYTSSETVLLYANACCCVSQMQADVNTRKCSCDSIEVKNSLYAWAQLAALKRAIGCGDKINKAIEILKTIQQICANSQCTNC